MHDHLDDDDTDTVDRHPSSGPEVDPVEAGVVSGRAATVLCWSEAD